MPIVDRVCKNVPNISKGGTDMSSLFPEGLSEKEFKLLTEYSNQVRDIPLKKLISMADEYLKQVHIAYLKNGFINYPLAEAIHGIIHIIYDEWDSLPAHARSWCRGMIQYFIEDEDDENDLNSPIGFEDDAEIMNACLKLAGWHDLCINPEDYDDV